MALFYVLQQISIPNYPAKFFWVNLMPIVNVNVASYLPCGLRLKNEVNLHVSLCLSSVLIFTLCVWNSVYWQSTVSSRFALKERGKHARFLCFSSMFIFTDGFLNLVYWQGTVSSRLTLKERGIHMNTYMFPCVYLRCLFSLHAVHVCWDENASGLLHYNKMQSSNGNSPRQVVDKIIPSPNRTNRPNWQTCKGHCH